MKSRYSYNCEYIFRVGGRCCYYRTDNRLRGRGVGEVKRGGGGGEEMEKRSWCRSLSHLMEGQLTCFVPFIVSFPHSFISINVQPMLCLYCVSFYCRLYRNKLTLLCLLCSTDNVYFCIIISFYFYKVLDR